MTPSNTFTEYCDRSFAISLLLKKQIGNNISWHSVYASRVLFQTSFLCHNPGVCSRSISCLWLSIGLGQHSLISIHITQKSFPRTEGMDCHTRMGSFFFVIFLPSWILYLIFYTRTQRAGLSSRHTVTFICLHRTFHEYNCFVIRS